MLKRLDFKIPDDWEEPLFGFAERFGIQTFSSPEIAPGDGGEEEVRFTGNSTVSFLLSSQEHDISRVNQKICAFLQEAEVAFSFSEVDYSDDEDWMEQFRSVFVPIRIRPDLIVRPPWASPLPEEENGATCLLIDPGMAFGTGTHETTRLCLKTLTEIPISPENSYLDIGAGSGILSFLLLKSGATDVTAVEIDGPAVENLRKNAEINGLSKSLKVVCSDFQAFQPTQMVSGICANITSPVLLENFSRFFEWLSSGGWALFSGVNSSNLAEITQGLHQFPWKLEKEESEGEWHALLMRKP